MAEEFQCPISQETMDKALNVLREKGILVPTDNGEDIIHVRLRDYCIKATEKLTDDERVAIICLSGLCICEKWDEEVTHEQTH